MPFWTYKLYTNAGHQYAGYADIQVVQDALKAMRAAALSAYPREACGILLGQNEGERGGRSLSGFVQTANVHPTPETHFEIDPQALIDAHRAERKGGPKLMGYFHSHPIGEPVPSAIDRTMAARDGKVWAIVAGDRVRFWQDRADGFCALSYDVIDR